MRNPYMRNAKLSKEKLRLVIQAFSFNETVAQCAREARISEKTVRELYWGLRVKLYDAMHDHPHLFGGAGYYLAPGAPLSRLGQRFLKILAESEGFAAHFYRVAPRTTDQIDAGLVLIEYAIRSYHVIALDRDEHRAEAIEIASEFQEYQRWIKSAIVDDPVDEVQAVENLIAKMAYNKARLAEEREIQRHNKKALYIAENEGVKYLGDTFYRALLKYIRFNPLEIA